MYRPASHRLPRWFTVLAVLALPWVLALAAGHPPEDPEASPQAAYDVARRIVQTGDHAGRPFVVVHKRAGLVLVHRANGQLAGISSALLGVTVGDKTADGVGERTRRGTLRTSDFTTPAGRFESEPGRNLNGEPIVWIDYASALAIHRLRPGAARTRRASQLASDDAGDKRSSAGCVVVPEAFFDGVIGPVLGNSRGIVYVLPERSSWRELWPGLAAASP